MTVPVDPGIADLILEGVTVSYVGRREPALAGLDLVVQPGQLVGVAGRTGAGKSTVALVAAGFIPRVVRARLSGRATLGTQALDTANGGALLGRVGIVFSTPANQLSASKLTVREELAFGLENLGLPRAEMDPRIDAVMTRLGIGHLADREPFALSGGEQQRVAIASIVTMGTGLLVLDEPTAQLDPTGTATVGGLLVDLARDGTAVVCTEHSPVILGRVDRCLILDGGRSVTLDVPGRALGSARLEPIGLTAPTLVRLAESAGLDPEAAFDPAAVAQALAATGAPLDPTPDEAAAMTLDWRPAPDRPGVGLAVEQLVHRYPTGVEALHGVSLTFQPGETVALVGQNGSGKTTLAKHLNGLLRPTVGRVTLEGADIAGSAVHELAATIGFVFQNPDDQLFDRSVEREVAFGPRNLGRPRDAIERAVTAALGAVGLGAARQTNPYDLDLTQRKLVALASILAIDPAALILDEPTTGQDDPGVRRIGAIVDALAEAGRTVIAITHDMEFAASHFSRIVVMREGVVIADGPPATVFASVRAALLATAGLELPPAAQIGAALGLDSTPTLGDLRAALAGRH